MWTEKTIKLSGSTFGVSPAMQRRSMHLNYLRVTWKEGSLSSLGCQVRHEPCYNAQHQRQPGAWLSSQLHTSHDVSLLCQLSATLDARMCMLPTSVN